MISERIDNLKRPQQSLDVYLLGLVEFESCLSLQERLADEISQQRDRRGALILCEHPPIITMGRDASHAHLVCEPGELVVRNMEVRWLNRGGGAVVHAPGQLAAYPILPVDRLGFGLAELRARLELSLLDVCREQRVAAWREATEPGVWCRCGRLAALGVAVRSGVTQHGLFLNVSPSMELQRFVRMPSDGRVSTLAAQRSRPTSMHSVRESLIRNLSERFGYEQFHAYTGHPSLRRTQQVVAIA
ncbi:MAG: lipoyl(octanoyl) transferase [Planctomycetales bacterium]|nr:lipoyl(octanoyl) transferase [Planctomycetales bacterium]